MRERARERMSLCVCVRPHEGAHTTTRTGHQELKERKKFDKIGEASVVLGPVVL